MRGRWLRAMLLGAVFCGVAVLGQGYALASTRMQGAWVMAQANAGARGQAASGSITGELEDSTGAVIAGAVVTVENPASGWRKSVRSDRTGAFHLTGVSAGRYVVTVTAKDFKTLVLHGIAVAPGVQRRVHAVLSIAQVSTRITVEPLRASDGAASLFNVTQAARDASRNSAVLLSKISGVSLRGKGEFASVPMLHGLGDERMKLVVNGMTVSNACPNHMNPPLSYIAPSNVGKITVMAGITPVSQGGDSLGGTILVQSAPPVFAMRGKPVLESGNVSSFYRSNGESYGVSTSEWIAGPHFFMSATNGLPARWPAA